MNENKFLWLEKLIKDDLGNEPQTYREKVNFEDSQRFDFDSSESLRKSIKKNEEKNFVTHVYLANRPGAKLAQLSKAQREKSKLLQDTTLKLVD